MLPLNHSHRLLVGQLRKLGFNSPAIVIELNQPVVAPLFASPRTAGLAKNYIGKDLKQCDLIIERPEILPCPAKGLSLAFTITAIQAANIVPPAP
jgi:hypothetical protein